MTGMSLEIEADYEKQWLFPPSLEMLLSPDHPARMVREFVDQQDLAALGFKTRKAEEGRPSYSAKLLLKVWLYGYVDGNRSCRGLERACLDQMGMLWLTGMNSPDHTTLWRFWRDNQKPIRKTFKQLLKVALSLNLVGLVLHAVDGTKILSAASDVNGLHRSKLKERLQRLDEAIDEILKQTEQASGQDSGEFRLPEGLQDKQELRDKIQEQLDLLDLEGRDHLNPGDEDARVMRSAGQNRFAYNAQAVADEASGLIVAADVVTDESDNYQLVPMLDEVKENLGKVAEQNLADAGYKAVTGLAEAEGKNYPVLVNLAEPDGPYDASRFIYDEQNDQCICPRGERLDFHNVKKRNKTEPYQVRVYRCEKYLDCPVRWQCSSSQTGRTVQIHPNHDALVRQREKHKDETLRAALKKRSVIIEPVFAWGKQGMNFRRWTVRGLEKVKTQWSMVCTAINLRRLHKHWVMGKLRFTQPEAAV
jgi:transposase